MLFDRQLISLLLCVHTGDLMPRHAEGIVTKCFHSPNIRGVLLFQDAGGQGVLRIVIVDGNGDLGNDRSVIQARPHEVNGAACHLHSGLDGLPLGMEAAEARQKRRVDVQDAVRKRVDEIFPQMRMYPARQIRSGEKDSAAFRMAASKAALSA